MRVEGGHERPNGECHRGRSLAFIWSTYVLVLLTFLVSLVLVRASSTSRDLECLSSCKPRRADFEDGSVLVLGDSIAGGYISLVSDVISGPRSLDGESEDGAGAGSLGAIVKGDVGAGSG